MKDRFVVVLNGESQLEYDRQRRLSPQQMQYLDKMDKHMGGGISLGADIIESPNQLQRAQFVAMALIQALQQQNESLAAATCSYLASRMPELRQLKIAGQAPEQSVDLVFDKDYVKSVPVQFVKPDFLNS